jgi:hypothetical protein
MNRGWKNYLLKFFWISILSIMFLGCNDGELPRQKCRVQSVDGQLDDVLGKWRLIGMRNFYMQTGKVQDVDFSCDNVIYHFNENAVVLVEGNADDNFYPEGEYDFELDLTPFHETMQGFTLKIGKTSWPCYIQSDRMTLDSSPTDGSVLYFVRVEL